MKKYNRLGVTDERDGCDCCGRTGLKAVVALEEIATNEIVYFGSTCAVKAEGWGSTAKDGRQLQKELKADAEALAARLGTLREASEAGRAASALRADMETATEAAKRQGLDFVARQAVRRPYWDRLSALDSEAIGQALDRLREEDELSPQALRIRVGSLPYGYGHVYQKHMSA